MPNELDLEKQKESTRQRIISAAMNLFRVVGYERASTRAIAKAARVNEVTLFRLFGSKQNLLSASIGDSIARNFAVEFPRQMSGNYAEDINHMAQLQIKATAANLDMLRLLSCDARNVPEVKDVMLTGKQANIDYLCAFFQELIDRKTIRAGLSAMDLAITFRNLFNASLLYDNLFQEGSKPQLPDADMVRAQVDIFIQGTRA